MREITSSSDPAHTTNLSACKRILITFATATLSRNLHLPLLPLGKTRNVMGKKRNSKSHSDKKGNLNRRSPSSRQDAVVEILRGKNINAHLIIHRNF